MSTTATTFLWVRSITPPKHRLRSRRKSTHRESETTMKITKLRVRRVTGTMPTDGIFWEERLLRPVDIYPEFRAEGAGHEAHGGKQTDSKHLKLTQFFVDIESDDGVIGCGGPVAADPARLVLTQLAPLIIGRDPLAIEYLWDIMHRKQVHGRHADPMIALSA